MKVIIGGKFFFFNLGGKTNCWLPFVKLQNFSSLPISEVPESGPTVQLRCVYTAVRTSPWVLEVACALLEDSVVLLLPPAGTSSEVPVWHGRQCVYILAMTGPASLQWWPAGHSRVHERLSSVSCAEYTLCALGCGRMESEVGEE